ncbi:MAG: FMN-binding negative transcriptional regulator, partial [Bacteroidota bacterium]|nr:FMN-binding negative transcriptional regulator [Bacteroidota bacterium]
LLFRQTGILLSLVVSIFFLLNLVILKIPFQSMYNLPYFKEQDKEVILEFIHRHPFAFLSGCDEENKPGATQVPVFIDEKDRKLFLTGHMMRQTDHHKAFLQNQNVLAVFTGPHTYVSATWYSNPNQASTWNYMSVHAKGTIRFLDEDGLIQILKKTTLHFENKNADSPTVFDNLPEEYRQRLMKSIVAFEIEVQQIDNVFKLSQNRDEKSYQHIIEKLEKQDNDAKQIAKEMETRTSQLFNDGVSPQNGNLET